MPFWCVLLSYGCRGAVLSDACFLADAFVRGWWIVALVGVACRRRGGYTVAVHLVQCLTTRACVCASVRRSRCCWRCSARSRCHEGALRCVGTPASAGHAAARLAAGHLCPSAAVQHPHRHHRDIAGTSDAAGIPTLRHATGRSFAPLAVSTSVLSCLLRLVAGSLRVPQRRLLYARPCVVYSQRTTTCDD
jgi:hypothetical protein